MNKLLIMPLAFMFILTAIVSMVTQLQPTGSSDNLTDTNGGIIVTGHDPTNGTVTIPRAGSHTFNIWGVTGIMVIMVIAIGIGIVGGIRVLGSGLSPESQMMIFNSIFFLGLWACLTIVSRNIMFENPVMMMIWFIITLMFVVGLATHLNRNAVEG